MAALANHSHPPYTANDSQTRVPDSMIVCNCNCLKERELMQACRPDIESAEQLYATLGCQLKCGRCVPYVQEIMTEQMSGALLA